MWSKMLSIQYLLVKKLAFSNLNVKFLKMFCFAEFLVINPFFEYCWIGVPALIMFMPCRLA
jgi:hypothetical protein